MPLNTKTPQQFVSDCISAFAAILTAAGIQYSPNLPPGDPFLALMQAKTAGGDMFLQSAAQECYTFARASTATGPDLDSWMADYGFFRTGATQADGQVTFSLQSANLTNIYINPGTIIQTPQGGIQYTVIADTNRSAWSVTLQQYVLPAGQLSINVSVQAVLAGSASNVGIGQLTQLGTAVPSVLSVTNGAAINNGEDAESDAQFRQNFILYFNSRARATSFAYIQLIDSLNLNIQSISIVENQNQNGVQQYGYVTIVVDDGSGATPSGTISTIVASLPQVRACGVQVYVAPAAGQTMTIALNVRLGPSAVGTTSQTNAAIAIADYINGLSIGQTLYYNKLIQVAIDADPNILSVEPTSLTINGVQADYVPTALQVCRTIISDVTVGTY